MNKMTGTHAGFPGCMELPEICDDYSIASNNTPEHDLLRLIDKTWLTLHPMFVRHILMLHAVCWQAKALRAWSSSDKV